MFGGIGGATAMKQANKQANKQAHTKIPIYSVLTYNRVL